MPGIVSGYGGSEIFGSPDPMEVVSAVLVKKFESPPTSDRFPADGVCWFVTEIGKGSQRCAASKIDDIGSSLLEGAVDSLLGP